MKLGESGEAFFVEELEDSDDLDIPDNLATSPIPVSELESIFSQVKHKLHSKSSTYHTVIFEIKILFSSRVEEGVLTLVPNLHKVKIK